jgi:hypothetical protein
MKSATINRVAKATRTLKLSLKDKVLAITLVSRNILGTKIRKNSQDSQKITVFCTLESGIVHFGAGIE